MRFSFLFSILSILFFFVPKTVAQEMAKVDSIDFSVGNNSEQFYLLDSIFIEGNKVTRAKTILRELDIAQGDTLWVSELNKRLESNRNQVYNLGIFNEVKLEIKQFKGDFLDLNIAVTERWYWLLFPIFELSDRNFNVWWNEYNHDIRRTKYGFVLYKNNARGRNEQFTFFFKWGFNRRFIMRYYFPFIDKKKVWGLNVESYYFADRELIVRAKENQGVNYRHTSFANSSWGGAINISRRRNIFGTHNWQLAYQNSAIVDTVFSFNPQYFNNQKNQQQLFSAQYLFEYDKRNIHAYPTEGYYFRGRVQQVGMGVFDDIGRTIVEANFSKYGTFNEHFSWATNVKIHTEFGGDSPYNKNTKLGTLEHLLRGYENQLIDVQDYIFVRNAARWKFADWEIRAKNERLKALNYVPIQFYLRVFGELGASRDRFFSEENPLNNAFLAGYGIGIDVVTLYDNLFSFEYTFNRHNQHGFILQINTTWDF